jgi:hypothetical protein
VGHLVADRARRVPRLLATGLGVLTAILLLVFSLDTPPLTIGFLVHNIPTVMVLTAVAVAWRWQRVGAASYVALGLVAAAFFSVWRNPAALVVVVPLLVSGVLCWIGAGGAKRQGG